ncbi:MAG: VWA domain-containing protein, partial [Actinomycetota bacterium]
PLATPAAPDRSDVPAIVAAILDRSGSMEHLRGAVVEGVNVLLGDLDPADRVTIVQFDSEAPYDVIVDGIPAAEVAPITTDQYAPRGGTPLYDAVGTAIARTAGKVREAEILTGVTPKVVLAILTDGYENASREYSAVQVRRLIEQCQADGWTVTYVGIGLGDEAYTEAAALGVEARSTLSVTADRSGTLAAMDHVRDLRRST